MRPRWERLALRTLWLELEPHQAKRTRSPSLPSGLPRPRESPKRRRGSASNGSPFCPRFLEKIGHTDSKRTGKARRCWFDFGEQNVQPNRGSGGERSERHSCCGIRRAAGGILAAVEACASTPLGPVYSLPDSREAPMDNGGSGDPAGAGGRSGAFRGGEPPEPPGWGMSGG